MRTQKLTKMVPDVYISYGVTYAEVIDWFSARGYDITFDNVYPLSPSWTASVCYGDNPSFRNQIQDDNGEFLYSDDWEEVANRVIGLAITLMAENNKGE